MIKHILLIVFAGVLLCGCGDGSKNYPENSTEIEYYVDEITKVGKYKVEYEYAYVADLQRPVSVGEYEIYYDYYGGQPIAIGKQGMSDEEIAILGLVSIWYETRRQQQED
jgi:hypothetical protein